MSRMRLKEREIDGWIDRGRDPSRKPEEVNVYMFTFLPVLKLSWVGSSSQGHRRCRRCGRRSRSHGSR